MTAQTKSASLIPKVLGWLGGEYGAELAAQEAFKASHKRTMGMVPGETMLMKLKMGVDPFMSVKKRKGLRNAYFNPTKDEISYDPDVLNKPGVLAHEFGHKLIHEGKAGILMKLLQDYGYGPSKILGPVASIPATVALTRAYGRNPIMGGLIGAGTGGVLSLPYLLPEWKATDIAKKRYLRWRMFQRKQNEETMNRAFYTYLAAAIGAPVGLGIATGMEKSKFLPDELRFKTVGDAPGKNVLKQLGKWFRLLGRK